MKSNVSAYFSIRTQFENIGDALINRELVRLVAENAPVLVDLSRCPPDFRRALRIESIAGASVLESSAGLFRSLLAARLTGNITYYFLSPGGYFGELSFRDGMAYAAKTAMLRLLKLIGVRVCLIGVSYDRLGARRASLLRRRARLLWRHVVRDSASLALARDRGIRVDGLMPDLAFGACAECLDIASRPRPQCLALSFRVDQHPGQAALVARTAEGIVARLPVDWKVVVVAQVTRDVPFAKSLTELLRVPRSTPVEFARCDEDFHDCKSVYGGVTVIVSNRLHALLGATLCGALPIPLVEREVNAKVLGWARDTGILESVHLINESNVGPKIAQAITTLSIPTVPCQQFAAELTARVREVMHD